jgi:cyclic beta-1,2-glucan synthetase
MHSISSEGRASGSAASCATRPVRAAALLLDERVPRRYTTRQAQSDAPTDPLVRPPRPKAVEREFDTPDTTEPRVGLLGSQSYCVLLTNAGGGYSRSTDIDVFRWRADATRDATGHWIYLRDVSSGDIWSAAHQPVRAKPTMYQASFAPDRVVFSRTDHGIDTNTEIVVVPRERTEIRRVTLTNRSRVEREIELTSYGEVVLTTAGADRAHPAFQNLFVETEWLPAQCAVLASRRPRASNEHRPWCAHVVATGHESITAVSCETDRAQFIGRGRTVQSPRALDRAGPLSNTAGAVLDPIFALRARVRLEPGRSATIAFTTVVTDTRDEALIAADRHRDLGAAERALALSWTVAQIEMRDLDVSPEAAALYQELAGSLIYPRAALRAPQAERAANRAGQSALWAHGISGDWPIVLATIRAEVGLPSVRQLLVAHNYWRTKGVKADLIILNAKEPSYIQELQDQITAMVISSSEGGMLEVPGGVYIRRSDVLQDEAVSLLRALASVSIVCDGVGTWRDRRRSDTASHRSPAHAVSAGDHRARRGRDAATAGRQWLRLAHRVERLSHRGRRRPRAARSVGKRHRQRERRLLRHRTRWWLRVGREQLFLSAHAVVQRSDQRSRWRSHLSPGRRHWPRVEPHARPAAGEGRPRWCRAI